MRNKIKLFFVALPLVAIIGLIGYFVIWPMLQPDSSNSEEGTEYVCLSQQKVNELNFTDGDFLTNKKKFDDCLASLRNAENHQLDSIDCINNARETLYGKFIPKCIEHYKNYFKQSTWYNLSGVRTELQQYLDALTNIDANSGYVNNFRIFLGYIDKYDAALKKCSTAQSQKTVESYKAYAKQLNDYFNSDPLCNNKDIEDKINNAKQTAQNAVANEIYKKVCKLKVSDTNFWTLHDNLDGEISVYTNDISPTNTIIRDAKNELKNKKQDKINKTNRI